MVPYPIVQMAEGDIRLDDEFEFEDGTRVVLFAIENAAYPGGVHYRFAYVDPNAGEELLRYDNSKVPRHGAGVHHRHCGDDVSEIGFKNLESHVSQFRSEVTQTYDDRD